MTHPNEKIIQITGVGDILYGLDVGGKVWKYVPQPVEGTRPFSFWTSITEFKRSSQDGL